MYIPEFWCGVIATVLFEVAALFFYAVYVKFKGGEKDETT